MEKIISFNDAKNKINNEIAKQAITNVVLFMTEYISSKIILVTETIYFGQNINDLFLANHESTIAKLIKYCMDQIGKDIDSLIHVLPSREFIDTIDPIITNSIIFFMEHLEDYLNDEK